jgi:hypothetical protein
VRSEDDRGVAIGLLAVTSGSFAGPRSPTRQPEKAPPAPSLIRPVSGFHEPVLLVETGMPADDVDTQKERHLHLAWHGRAIETHEPTKPHAQAGDVIYPASLEQFPLYDACC